MSLTPDPCRFLIKDTKNIGRQKQADLHEFEASLVYRASSRTGSKAIEKPCLAKQTKKHKTSRYCNNKGILVAVIVDYVPQAGLEHLGSADLPILASRVAKAHAGGHCLAKTPAKGWE